MKGTNMEVQSGSTWQKLPLSIHNKHEKPWDMTESKASLDKTKVSLLI